MYKIIQADGVTIGKSERFAIPPLINKARAVTTVNQDGVMIWTEANASLSEFLGGGYDYMHESCRRVYSPDGAAPTLNTCSGGGVNAKIIVEGEKEYVVIDGKKCRVRRLTERERFRLMGVKDEDFERIAKNQSKSSLCHLSGDSIVVDVLMAIFGEML